MCQSESQLEQPFPSPLPQFAALAYCRQPGSRDLPSLSEPVLQPCLPWKGRAEQKDRIEGEQVFVSIPSQVSVPGGSPS